jgi:hypothetical protein
MILLEKWSLRAKEIKDLKASQGEHHKVINIQTAKIICLGAMR